MVTLTTCILSWSIRSPRAHHIWAQGPPRAPGPTLPPNPPSERAGLRVGLPPRVSYHEVYVRHVYTISVARGAQGPGPDSPPNSQTSSVIKGRGPLAIKIGCVMLSWSIHSPRGHHIWAQGPPGAPGPTRPQTCKLTNFQTYKVCKASSRHFLTWLQTL